MTDEKTYRVFISYSHDDTDLADNVAEVLEQNGLQPMRDKNFSLGSGFHDQIKDYIAHAHVFMPIITPNSSFWVHQEIGYAKALDIPVVPVSFGLDPGQMISDRQAVQWDNGKDWFERNKANLSLEAFERVMFESRAETRPLYECASLQQQRTKNIIDYAKKVISLGGQGHVRQKGALSSFHIPEVHVGHPAWRERYGKIEMSENRCRRQLEERLVLQQHAIACGCSLIIDPTLTYGKYGQRARVSRLQELLNFLEEIPADKVQVAVNAGMAKAHNILIVGNWFVAESKTAAQGKGYEQTTFTRHTPTIEAMIEEFDREFKSILKMQDIEPQNSVPHAIETIKKIITELD